MRAPELIDGEAEMDLADDEHSYDEDGEDGEGDQRPGTRPDRVNGDLQDSSEEEEDDDDEEEARRIREGFIVDEDDEDEEPAARGQRRRGDKKRRRVERAREEEGLDEEDLDLIGEANPEFERRAPSESKFKRLKRGHGDDDQDRAVSKDLEAIFSDDDEVEDKQAFPNDRLGRSRPEPRSLLNEFEDFIEEDELSDEEERYRQLEEREVARPKADGFAFDAARRSGFDDDAINILQEAFGDGGEYDWALELQEDVDAQPTGARTLGIRQLFDPAQLAEKMMTEDDDVVRLTDEPERFQVARRPYRHLFLTDEQVKEEALWVSRMMPKRNLPESLRGPFLEAVAKVLEFLVADNVEVPFVFQHRKDYLIHAVKVPITPDPSNPDGPQYIVNAEKLLNQDDLWQILEYDLKFRALIDKRNSLQRTYQNLKAQSNVTDLTFEEMLPAAETMEEIQDLQDYLYFQHASLLKDLKILNGDTHGAHRRPGQHKSLFERIRTGKVYGMVRAFGITTDAFAQNALGEARRQYADDPSMLPDDLADTGDMIDPPEFATGAQVLKAAKMMFAEEMAMHPKLRKFLRRSYYLNGLVGSSRTDKGLRQIDEQHPYYEFKYLRNQQLSDIARQPDMFLKMLKAEEEGLVEVGVRLHNLDEVKKDLFGLLSSDNFSEIADAWNGQRREVLDRALSKLGDVMARGVKENLKTRCEDEIAAACREEYSRKLDQAPFKPAGMPIGTTPRVLALSLGGGSLGRNPIHYAWLEEDGRVLETGQFNDIVDDEEVKKSFVDLVQRRRPDVIGVAGFTVGTRQLARALEMVVGEFDLRGSDFEDPETGEDHSKPLDVVMVNDEVARLYQDSDRAANDHPGIPVLARYCVALARYLQDPMKEYAALGRDIISVPFHPNQYLVPGDKLVKQLESAMVDMVNLCGVNLMTSASNPYVATLLPYICGLGPRKAGSLIDAVHMNGNFVATRSELLGDVDRAQLPAMGQRVWVNCASFLELDYDNAEPSSEYLDNTRVHPDDYYLARKIAADALELDEEDIKAETDEAGPGAVVRRLIREDAQEKVNDLVLEEYAEQLEVKFAKKKRATLETIRAELQQPYEELRRNFALLSTDEIFTMLAGETRESLCPGMTVPVSIRRILNHQRQLEVVLDCGVTGVVFEDEISDRLNPDVPLNQIFAPHQIVQAKILNLSRSTFEATLSLREDAVQQPFRKQFDRLRDEWDHVSEKRDQESLRERNNESSRAQRVIKHPLFRSFNSTQAEEFLGSQARGDAVIRPSSKGVDHIAITWKVSDNVYQHIDVLELDKESEFSVGQTLKIAGKYTYSDLDELIVNHVKAMARKVDEMTLHEKYQNGSKADTERWLTTYTEANPKRSVYAFCIDPKHPGYFFLCFKAGQLADLANWPVKIVPSAFELRGNAYPDMRALCNGFKLLVLNQHNGSK